MLSKWFRTSALWAFRVQLGLNGLGSEGGVRRAQRAQDRMRFMS